MIMTIAVILSLLLSLTSLVIAILVRKNTMAITRVPKEVQIQVIPTDRSIKLSEEDEAILKQRETSFKDENTIIIE